MGTEKMIVTQLVLALCVGFSLAQEAPERKEAVELDGRDGAGPAGTDRSKRLFFVSTTSSTSTLVTRFTCYVSKAALVSCKKRRKRSYLEESPDVQPQSFAEEAIVQQGFSLSPKALKMKALILLQDSTKSMRSSAR